MEGAPISTPEDSSEKDSSDSKTEKKSKKSREIGSIIAGAEKAAEKAEKKEKVAKEVSLLDKLFSGEKLASETKPGEADREKVVEQSEMPAEEAPLSDAEERVAGSLQNEGEIDLRGIPPERDSAIIERAVSLATVEQAAEDTAKPQQEVPVVATTELDLPEYTEEAQEIPAAEVQAGTIVETAEDSDNEDDSTPAYTTRTAASSRAAATSSTTGSGAAPVTPAAHAAAGAGGTRPPTPPPPVGSSAGSSARPLFPHRRYAAGTTYTAPLAPGSVYTAPAAANTAVSAANVASAVEDAEYYAYKRGRNKGLVAGLIVGGGIEHIRHKRREKKMERKFAVERKQVTRNIENQRWDQIREAESAKVREAAAEKYRTVERPSAAIRPEANRTEQAQSAREIMQQRTEIKAEIEKKLVAEHKEAERVVTKAEQTEIDRQREQLELVQGHHIERSAWHNIEVDKHGKAVQETSLVYGHEYYKERAHETRPKSKQVIDGAAGEVALVAAVLAGGGGGSPPNNGQSPAAQSSTASRSTSIPAQSSASQPKSLIKTITHPPTTPAGTAGWFIVLVVLLAVLAVVIF
ncbi:hypothetical protein IPL85_01660 [Candidatus Saccharibacteria bacterium]|nr:MAG: hypothetical protein IPL85_01660 [Candidatus Saccharibacteria bacterium]